MFYVYEWFIKNTGEIIYVGKGCKKRYLCKKHNKLFKETIKNNDCDSRIIKYFEKEGDAFNCEYETIKRLKQKGQCICNLYDGGFGGETQSWTTDKRLHYSKHNIMKRPEQRKRMAEQNPMKNSKIAKKVGVKHRKPFYIGNKLFQTLEEAGKSYNCDITTVRYWLKVGHNKNELCYYENNKPINYDFSKNNHITNNIKIIYNDKEYNSLKDLARYLNMKYTTLHKYFKQNKPINGKNIYLWQGNQQPSASLNDL